jgi:hypothetical protein
MGLHRRPKWSPQWSPTGLPGFGQGSARVRPGLGQCVRSLAAGGAGLANARDVRASLRVAVACRRPQIAPAIAEALVACCLRRGWGRSRRGPRHAHNASGYRRQTHWLALRAPRVRREHSAADGWQGRAPGMANEDRRQHVAVWPRPHHFCGNFLCIAGCQIVWPVRSAIPRCFPGVFLVFPWLAARIIWMPSRRVLRQSARWASRSRLARRRVLAKKPSPQIPE